MSMIPQTRSRSRRALGAGAITLFTVLLGLLAWPCHLEAADDTKQQLLEMTGGRRVKVAWNQGADENNMQLMFFDTKVGKIIALPFAGSAPLISVDGKRVFASVGKASDRMVKMYDTETRKVTDLARGAGNHLLAVWRDPKTKIDWVYVNSSGDKNENWDVAGGEAIYRFPINRPQARELFWDRTSSHIYLMLSADGTRACFEPSWANIGQMTLAFDTKGKVDQDASTFQKYGGGCFPSLAPDNSYRLFRLDGDHRSITMSDDGNLNSRKIKIDEMLTADEKKAGRSAWLTRWSTDPRYLTLIAPAGKSAKLWMGRFNEDFTAIEQWAQVSAPNGPQCWQSQAWVEPAN
jgi:hypothetical protein